MVNIMKKKDFLIKVTMIDIWVVSVLLIAGLTVPVFQNLMASLFYKPWIYGILCMNLVIDLLLLILNKLNRAGNLIRQIHLCKLKDLMILMQDLMKRVLILKSSIAQIVLELSI